ncbi:MAG: GNAT family N-acetyltransferase [Caldilineaceae bacterium]
MTLTLRTIPARHLDPRKSDEILALCSAAYEEDFGQYADLFSDPIHVLAEEDGRLVSHALWIERILEADHRLQLRTAYVEAVATLPALQGRGYGSAVMRALGAAIQDGYDLAALSPSDPAFYARFGWELWQGPLLVRTGAGTEAAGEEAAGEEEAMILRLPATPPLDLTWSLSVEWRPIEPW